MRKFTRAALAVASLFCLLGTATISGPSFAAEGSTPAGSATAMLASVTAPLLAVDIHKLEASAGPDFSTDGNAAGSVATSDPAGQQAAALPQSLQDLVSDKEADTTGDTQGDCLASSVYYESKGEPLEGQLAVAQTIMNRTTSSRFPSDVCDVVRQPGQFSFVRHGEIPQPSHSNSAWKRAVAVALIARNALWKQVAPDALFFHARRVSPGWGKIKVASLGHHIFFR